MRRGRLSLLLVFFILLLSRGFVFGQADDALRLLDQNKQGVVSLVVLGANKSEIARGTGFALTENMVATNYHLVCQASNVEAYTFENKKLKVEGILAVDRDSDLVLLRTKGKLQPLIPGNFDSLVKDQKMYGIGANEVGDIIVVDGTIRKIAQVSSKLKVADAVISVPKNFTGGPLLDATGQVMGILTVLDRGFKFLLPVGLARTMNPSLKPTEFKNWQQEDYPALLEGTFFFGRAAAAIGDTGNAQKYLEKVIKTNPSLVDAQDLMAKVYAEQRDYQQALAAYQKVIELDPSRADAYFEMGSIHLKTQKYTEAIRDFQKAVQLNINKKDAYYFIANAYEEMRDFANAASSYEVYLRLMPEDPATAQFRLGTCYTELNQVDKAILAFQEAVKGQPQDQRTNEYLAQAYMKGLQYDKAEETYRKLAQISPAEATRYYSIIVRMYDEANMADRGIDAARKLIELNPKNEVSVLNLGIIFYKLKRYDEAVATFRQALVLRPDYELAIQYIGICYNQQKKYRESVDAFRQYVQIVPDSVDGWLNIGINYMLLKDFRSALQPLRRCVELKPDHGVALYNLAIVYLNLGDRGAAGEVLQTLNTLDPDLAQRLRRILTR